VATTDTRIEASSIRDELDPPSELRTRTARDRSLIQSIGWNVVGDWGSQLFTWTSFIVVTRLLTPADFGIASMAFVLLPVFQYLAGFGIPRTIVLLRDLTDEQLAQLNTVALLLGCSYFAVAATLARPLALLLRTPKMASALIVLSVSLLVAGTQAISVGLLGRDLRFKTLSLFGASTSLVSAVLALLLAWWGLGYWALILGNLLAGMFQAVLFIRTKPHRYAFPRLDTLRQPLRFGSHLMVSSIITTASLNLDDLIAGRQLGPSALGIYGIAWSLANVPLEKVTTMVTTVVPGYLAVIRSDLSEVRRYLRNLTEGMALLTFPACVGLALVAEEFVAVALGSKWHGAVAPLRILASYAAFRSIVALLSKVLVAMGDSRFVMWNDLATLLVMGSAFFVGSRRGVAGIAWAWVVAYPIVVIPLYRKTFKTIEMRLSEYLSSIRPAIEGTAAMTLAVLAIHQFFLATGPLSRLCAEVVIGFLSYGAILLSRHRERTGRFLQLAKILRRTQEAEA
jgi:teichuronic acid exporter